MRLRRTVLTSALTAAVAVSLVAPAAEASAAVVHHRTTTVSLTAKHFSGGKVDLIAHSTWHHRLPDGHVKSGHAAGLPLVFQTFRSGKWVRIFRTAKSRTDGTFVIEGFPKSKGRYRVLLKKTTIGDYAYRGSKSKAIRA